MKYVKMLGLAAVAAMALMAFLGASSASANVLCTENATPCPGNHPTEKKYIVGDVVTATAVSPILTGSPEVTCDHSEVAIKITNAGGKNVNVTGEVTKLTFTGNCVAHTAFGDVGCTISAQGLNYHAEVLGSGASASITVREGPGKGKPRANVLCGGFINCTLGKTDFNLSITSGNPATVNAEEEPLELEAGGFGCPSEARWDADYNTTSGAVWVVKE